MPLNNGLCDGKAKPRTGDFVGRSILNCSIEAIEAMRLRGWCKFHGVVQQNHESLSQQIRIALNSRFGQSCTSSHCCFM